MMEKKKSGQAPALLLLEPIYIMLQIAVAVNYLHESWVMHCDLKVSNVLLNIVEDQNAYFSSSSVQDKLQHCCLSKSKLHRLGYNHTVGGYKPGAGNLTYLKIVVEACQKNGNLYRCPWSLYISFEMQVTRLACLLPLLTNCSSLQLDRSRHSE
jgi:serine/threonine protein kinase